MKIKLNMICGGTSPGMPKQNIEAMIAALCSRG
jgi:hypothetical protein